MNGCLSDPNKDVAKLHVIWGYASARQFRRVSADSDEGHVNLLTCVDEVLEQRGVCRAFDDAPHAPAAEPPLWPFLMRSYRRTCCFRATFCCARDGRFLQIFPVDARPYAESPGGSGRLSQLAG